LVIAFLAFYLAVYVKYALTRGEKGVVMLVASDRQQARVIFRYLQAFFSVKPFSDLVVSDLKESIELTSGIIIEIHTASFRSVRGYTVVAFIGDEIAFWNHEGSNPDGEILTAVRPAMVTIPTAMLICISSPYARRGELWKTYQRHFGKDSADVLVIQAPSLTMNPGLPRHGVEKAYEEDPAAAAAEYGAQFRIDIEGFVRREAVVACVVTGRYALPPVAELTYEGGLDVSSGSGQEDFALSITHTASKDGQVIGVLDFVHRVTPPFSPAAACAEVITHLRRYGIQQVHGDRYAKEWVREHFTQANIDYRFTDKSKSELFLELLPAINSGHVQLVDDPILISQLCGLERRSARGGRDTVDHAPGGKDDVINAVAIALVMARRRATAPALRLLNANPPDARTEQQWQEEHDKERAHASIKMLKYAAMSRGSWFPGD